ncbi:hypothetical protein WJX73_001674 [Symbiochloris irregularis]|uniref:Major facilitator superfamily (MFS) profile domain-containing protein n=1 Tax=Symbiochloris irregularis TaxID=706552 RepID=A0AAW1NWJ4_9CHLO
MIGSLLIDDTPNSLYYRGKPDEARRALQRLRGVQDVDAEFNDIARGVDSAVKAQRNAWSLFSWRNAGAAVATIVIPLAQQFTGINTIMIGRKMLFLEGAAQMCVAFVSVAIIMGLGFDINTGNIASGCALAIIILQCVFTSGFAWSWGPLGWLVTSEIHDIEHRTLGMAITTSVNFLASFIIGQTYLTMLCSLREYTYVFFAICVIAMSLYVHYFLIETKNVPTERMHIEWMRHWWWGPRAMDRERLECLARNDLVGAGLASTELQY